MSLDTRSTLAIDGRRPRARVPRCRFRKAKASRSRSTCCSRSAARPSCDAGCADATGHARGADSGRSSRCRGTIRGRQGYNPATRSRAVAEIAACGSHLFWLAVRVRWNVGARGCVDHRRHRQRQARGRRTERRDFLQRYSLCSASGRRAALASTAACGRVERCPQGRQGRCAVHAEAVRRQRRRAAAGERRLPDAERVHAFGRCEERPAGDVLDPRRWFRERLGYRGPLRRQRAGAAGRGRRDDQLPPRDVSVSSRTRRWPPSIRASRRQTTR